jgi:hypothetical protein
MPSVPVNLTNRCFVYRGRGWVMGTPAVSYQTGGLRLGSSQQSAVSAACTAVREALTAHGIEAQMLGAVPGVAAFHAVLQHVLRRQAADAGTESARRSDLAGRAARVAGLGIELVGDTTAVANAVRPTA